MGTPVRRIDHARQDGEGSLSNVIRVFDSIDGGGPVDAQTPHLVGFHDRVGVLNHLSPTSGRKKRAIGGLAELEWLVVLIHETDAVYEGRLGRVEALVGSDRDGSRSIGERS